MKVKAYFNKTIYEREKRFKGASPGFKLANGLHTSHVYSAHARYIITWNTCSSLKYFF